MKIYNSKTIQRQFKDQIEFIHCLSIAKLQLQLLKLLVPAKQNEAREKPRHRNPPQRTRKGRQDRGGGRTDALTRKKKAAQQERKQTRRKNKKKAN
jgi:hypothetical protein